MGRSSITLAIVLSIFFLLSESLYAQTVVDQVEYPSDYQKTTLASAACILPDGSVAFRIEVFESGVVLITLQNVLTFVRVDVQQKGYALHNRRTWHLFNLRDPNQREAFEKISFTAIEDVKKRIVDNKNLFETCWP